MIAHRERDALVAMNTKRITYVQTKAAICYVGIILLSCGGDNTNSSPDAAADMTQGHFDGALPAEDVSIRVELELMDENSNQIAPPKGISASDLIAVKIDKNDAKCEVSDSPQKLVLSCKNINDNVPVTIATKSHESWQFEEWVTENCYRMKECQFTSDSGTNHVTVRFRSTDQTSQWPPPVEGLHQGWAVAGRNLMQLSAGSRSWVREDISEQTLSGYDFRALALDSSGKGSLWAAEAGGFLFQYNPGGSCSAPMKPANNLCATQVLTDKRHVLGVAIADIGDMPKIYLTGVDGYFGWREDSTKPITRVTIDSPVSANLNAVWAQNFAGASWAVAVGDRSTILVAQNGIVKGTARQTDCFPKRDAASLAWHAVSGFVQSDMKGVEVWAVGAAGKVCQISVSVDGTIKFANRSITGIGNDEIEKADIHGVFADRNLGVWALLFTPPLDTGKPRENYLFRLGDSMNPSPRKIRNSSNRALYSLWIDSARMPVYAYAGGESGIHRVRLP